MYERRTYYMPNLPEEQSNQSKLPKLEDLSPRELVENAFIDLGFCNENPDDLDAVTDLLNIWRDDNIDDSTYEYSSEQYILLNDPDVIKVLNRCKEYYEPKRHLSKGDLRSILEDIAKGKITRRDYDFKNGEEVEIEPTFAERISAIKMLQENADNDNSAATVQFINNIISADPTQIPKPNLDAPQAPPEGHYSLNLEPDDDTYQEGDENI
jgi:hypothetical protein